MKERIRWAWLILRGWKPVSGKFCVRCGATLTGDERLANLTPKQLRTYLRGVRDERNVAALNHRPYGDTE